MNSVFIHNNVNKQTKIARVIHDILLSTTVSSTSNITNSASLYLQVFLGLPTLLFPGTFIFSTHLSIPLSASFSPGQTTVTSSVSCTPVTPLIYISELLPHWKSSILPLLLYCGRQRKDIVKRDLELIGVDVSVALDRGRWRTIIASLTPT